MFGAKVTMMSRLDSLPCERTIVTTERLVSSTRHNRTLARFRRNEIEV
jgi:hypothetical protein